jgi:hypothetical protein
VIRVDVVQGSPEWLKARIGVITASEFDNILTPSKLQPAKGDAYLRRMLAEILTGEPIEAKGSEWAERGHDMEDLARKAYAEEFGVYPERVGFVTTDDGRVGYSPDSFIGDDGLLEIKVLSAENHAGALIDPDGYALDHRGQCQGGLYVAERKWIDLMFWNPTMPRVIVRMEPDPKYLAALKPALEAFKARLDAAVERVRPASNPFLSYG